MGAMSKASAELYAEVSDAVLVEVEQIGVDGINAAGIVARFVGRGVSERQLYRWINQIMSSGQPGQHIARKIKAGRGGTVSPCAGSGRGGGSGRGRGQRVAAGEGQPGRHRGGLHARRGCPAQEFE